MEKEKTGVFINIGFFFFRGIKRLDAWERKNET